MTDLQTIEKNKAIVRTMLEAFGEGRYESFLSYLDDDVEFRVGAASLDLTIIHGKEAVRNSFKINFSSTTEEGYTAGYIGPISWKIHGMVGEGDTVVDWSQGYAKTADDTDYNNVYCRVWRLQNEKVVSIYEFLDTGYFQQVIADKIPQ